MTARIEYMKQSPELFKKFADFSLQTKKSTIETSLLHLVDLRASQINGCGFCVDMHSKEATLHNERPLRMYHLPVWRESALFSERERAALEWTETLTTLPPHGVSDEIFHRVREQFTEQELADLTAAVMAINGWNRVSIAFKSVPGSADKFYGLDKANLT